MEKTARSRTIFGTILFPLIALLVLELLIPIAIFGISGSVEHLKRDAEHDLYVELETRKTNLEYFMVTQWSDLDRLSAMVNYNTQLLLDSGSITLEELEADPMVCQRVLEGCYSDFIDELYAKRVNGIFVLFNTQDLTGMFAESSQARRTGFMIRDLDAKSEYDLQKNDLLLVRSPVSAIQALDMSVAHEWQAMFTFSEDQDLSDYGYFYRPFQAAYEAGHKADPDDYGYWAPGSAAQTDEGLSLITYSIPLVLEDGTVYGVLGIELFLENVFEHIPCGSKDSHQTGSDVLARIGEGENGQLIFDRMVSTDSSRNFGDWSASLTPSANLREGCTVEFNGVSYYAIGKQFDLYSENNPFRNETWMLLGVADCASLYSEADQIKQLSAVILVSMFVLGLLGSFLISRRLSGPIRRLSKEVAKISGFPELSRSGITEIDQFSDAFIQMSRNAVDASARVLNILHLTSMEIAAFEVRVGAKIFVTDNFFTMFGIEVEDSQNLSDEQFKELLQRINAERPHTKRLDGSTVYQIKRPYGEIRYIRLCFAALPDGMAAVAEDITAAEVEKKRLEHERDYDLLTGLFNRRAFYREAEAKFQDPEGSGHGAFITLDLDDLKRYNDTYGHEWGDQYITQAARSICAAAPANSFVTRLSGDEFALFVWGYDSQDAVRAAVDRFTQSASQTNRFVGPNGEEHYISFTGGVAWYPEDSKNMLELMKYADFAMYEKKKSGKGSLNEFSFASYNQESFLVQSRRELDEMLNNGMVQYHFQPIVSASDGSIYGYEALMRVDLPTLRTPDTVLNLARDESRLHDVERMTMLKSVEFYSALLKGGHVSPQAYLFVNSIADHCLDSIDQDELKRLAGPLVTQIVLEITENNELDPECLKVKREMTCYSGMMALDDYGSGYNGNKNLLELAPKYVKLDAILVRGIDSNQDKQALVSNLIDYAHRRNMLIVVEGIETTAELQTCIELKADLLQGYLLARPSAIPQGVSAVALQVIREMEEK